MRKIEMHVNTNLVFEYEGHHADRGGRKDIAHPAHLNRGYLPIVKRVLHIAKQQRRLADATLTEQHDFESRRVIVGTCHCYALDVWAGI